jgi:hypothetical protein
MRDWLQEVRYSARLLAKTPGFTVVAVLSLALGIGANTAVFSVFRSALLAPLPVADPDSLVVAYWSRSDRGDGIWQLMSGGTADPETGRQLNSNYPYSFYRTLRTTVADAANVCAFTFCDKPTFQSVSSRSWPAAWCRVLGVRPLVTNMIIPSPSRWRYRARPC